MPEFSSPKYPFLEYLYAGDPDGVHDALVGSAIRAVGKDWRVGVVSADDAWAEFRQQLSSSEQSNFLVIDPASPPPEGLNLLLLDEVQDRQEFYRLHPEVRGKMHVMASDSARTLESVADDSSFDLVSVFRSQLLLPSPPGLVSAFVGNGKGKTTSALGHAWNHSRGGRVAAVQWFKERLAGRLTWSINEHYFPDKLEFKTLWQFHPMGAGFYGSPALDRVAGEEAAQIHRQKALEGLHLAHQLLESDLAVLVLDELLDTLQEVMPSLPTPLLTLAEVQTLVQAAQAKNIPVVLTGRSVPEELRSFFDSITTIEALRHPWADQKRGAVSGLDF